LFQGTADIEIWYLVSLQWQTNQKDFLYQPFGKKQSDFGFLANGVNGLVCPVTAELLKIGNVTIR